MLLEQPSVLPLIVPTILNPLATKEIADHVNFSRTIPAGAALLAIAFGAGLAAQAASGAAPSACQARLSADRAIFKPLGELGGPPGCGGPDVIHLERIILADRSEVAIEPPATLRCETAEAIVSFVREDLAPAAAVMGAPLSAIENFDSYDCRGRNRIAGAKLSEHGLANALDIRSIRLKDGRVVHPTDSGVLTAFRVAMKAAACNRFTTVLGPGSDGYHEDHVHVDRAERHGGYRLCQWDLHEVAQTYALQSIAAPSRTGAAALPGLIPLPRPRPFAAAGARAVLPPAESHP